MRRRMKKVLATVMALTVAFSMVSTQAMAEGLEGRIPPSQSVEETVTSQEEAEVEGQEATAAEAEGLEAAAEAETEGLEATSVEAEAEAEVAEADVSKMDAEPKASYIFSEDFENGAWGNWTQSSGDDAAEHPWIITAGDHNLGVPTAHAGSNNALFYAGVSDAERWLITPTLNLSGQSGVKLNFWYVNRTWGGDTDQLKVSYRVGGGAWESFIFSSSGAHSEWTEMTVTLPSKALTSNIQIGFFAIGNYGNGIALDDVRVYAGSLESSTFTVKYNANGGSGTMTDANSPYSAFTSVTVLENQFTAPSGRGFLEWNTKANGSGVSYQPGQTFSIGNATTLYAIWTLPVTALEEGFESGLPSGWSTRAENTRYQWSIGTGDYNENFGAHGGERNAKVCAMASGSQGAVSWLMTPWLDLRGHSSGVLSFWFTNRAVSGRVDPLGVYYRTNTGSWKKLIAYTDAHASWTEARITLPSAALNSIIQIGFQATDAYSNGIALDDVEVYGLDGNSSYTVTYHANGGSGAMTDGNSYAYGAQVTVKSNAFTAPSNRAFAGWNTEADGSGTPYAAGDQFIIHKSVTLYAQWSPYVEIFSTDLTSLPSGWSVEGNNETFQWVQGSGSYWMTMSDQGEGSAWLISPSVNLSQYHGAFLDFYYSNENNEGEVDLFVYYRVGKGEWKLLNFTPTQKDGEWELAHVFIPESVVSKNMQFAFKSVSNGDNYNIIGPVALHGCLASDYHGILVNNDANCGYVSVVPGYGAAGDVITVSVTAFGPYAVSSLKVTKNGKTVSVTHANGVYTFVMPAEEVVISCTYTQTANWIIVSEDVIHGTVTASSDYAKPGERVTLQVAANLFYAITGVTVTCNGANVPVTAGAVYGTYSFVMPSGDAVVHVSFMKVLFPVFYEDFEHHGEEPEGWTFIDGDGDGNHWHSTYGNGSEFKPHGGHGLLTSASYDNGALTPDNWAITPAIKVPDNATLAFWVTAQDPLWTDENLRVYVGLSPQISAMSAISGEITATNYYKEYTYSLSAYAGKTVYIGFRHYDSSDMLQLNLDDVSVYVPWAYMDFDPVLMHYSKAALDGKLGLAFFVEIPEWLKSDKDAYVTFEQCGEIKKKSVADIVAAGLTDDGLYRVVTYMPAAYYRDTVTMRFYDGDGSPVTMKGYSSGTNLTTTGVTYTLQQYTASLMNSGTGSIKALAKAMDDYCTAAQIYFNHPTEGVTLTLSSAINSVTAAELEGYKAIKGGDLTSKVTNLSLSASFETDNAIKIGVTFAGSGNKPSGVKYYVSEDGTFGHAVATTLRGSKANGYYLTVRNIAAANLDKNYTFFIVDEKTNQTYYVTCSAYTYVRATAFKDDMPKSLRNMVKALYLYGKAAKQYFGSVTN